MNIPETITKVFTKYDTIPEQIYFPSLDSLKPIFRSDGSGRPAGYIASPVAYRRFAINQGLDDVLFVYYQRDYLKGFITETEGTITITNCKASG